MNRKRLSVTGMSCGGCERTVENALTQLDGVTRVEADHTDDTVDVVVEESVAEAALHTTIEQAGYDVST